MIHLILGGAVCVWDDLERFRRIYTGPVTSIAINEVGWMYKDRLDYWISLHPENFERKKWLLKRPRNDFETISHRRPKDVRIDHLLDHWGAGSSGLYAVTWALHVKPEWPKVLCGVPLDTQGNVDGRPDWKMKEVSVHRAGWLKQLHRFAEVTWSMSGWTRRVLGEPRPEWLQRKEAA